MVFLCIVLSLKGKGLFIRAKLQSGDVNYYCCYDRTWAYIHPHRELLAFIALILIFVPIIFVAAVLRKHTNMNMNARIGITGRPGIGKSTVVRRVIERIGTRTVGGMLTAELRDKERAKRVGFVVEDLSTGEKGILAHISERGQKVGKYGVNIRDLERVGASAIERAVENADISVIVIDEVGPMELKSEKFVNAAVNAIESDKDMIVTVHWRANHALIRRIKEEFDMCEVTAANRETLHLRILRSLGFDA